MNELPSQISRKEVKNHDILPVIPGRNTISQGHGNYSRSRNVLSRLATTQQLSRSKGIPRPEFITIHRKIFQPQKVTGVLASLAIR